MRNFSRRDRAATGPCARATISVRATLPLRQGPGVAVQSGSWEIPLIKSRISADCSRRPCPANGTNGSMMAHCTSVTSLGYHRGREQACACPPAQIPACALTHGAPASDDDERPLAKPRVLKPVAETRETPTQGRHRTCVLHCLIGSAEWSIPPAGWVLIPRGLYRLGDPDPLGRRHSKRKTLFRVSLRSFRIRSAAMTLSPQTGTAHPLASRIFPGRSPWLHGLLKASGRPLACASLGGLPTFCVLSIADVLHLPTIDHISSGPPKIPYVRFYRGREQACACPPAQIPACALTHGAPTSDDDERPLVRPRALKPVHRPPTPNRNPQTPNHLTASVIKRSLLKCARISKQNPELIARIDQKENSELLMNFPG